MIFTFNEVNEFINKTPFLRLIIPLCFGIISSIIIDDFKDISWIIYSGYLFLLTIYFLLFKSSNSLIRWCFGLLLNALIYFIGIQTCHINLNSNNKDHYSNYITGEKNKFIGYISEIPIEKERVISAKMDLIGQGNGNNFVSVSGKLVVYFEKGKRKINYGDEICFTGLPKLIEGPKNPGEFNYKEYLFYKNITHQFYLKDDEFVISGKTSINPLIDYAYNLRTQLLSILKENGLEGDEFGIAAALLLGYDDTISKELMNSYSHTGTLHVLSVSGMHVGILFLVLNLLLKFPEKKYFKMIKTIIILFVLWFYAMLSGLSPSVVRSTIMFSFILFGILIGRKGQIYNTIFASAFIMLLFNPFLIIDAGFQLSYLAVIGIVFFYPYIFKWYLPKSSFTSVIWKMFAVSLSAQIVTLPITLFYFHQFPVLFFVANLFVIPISYIVMFGSLLVILFSKIKIISVALAFVVSKSVAIMNWFTVLLDSVEFSNVSGINTGIFEMICLFILIASITYGLIHKNYMSLLFSLFTILFLVSFGIYSNFNYSAQKRIVFYSVKNDTAIQLIEGRSSVLICDSLMSRTEEIISNNSVKNGIETTNRINNFSGLNIIEFNGKKIAILNADTLSKYELNNSNIDLLYLCNNPWVKGIEYLNTKKIIVDATNNGKTVSFIKKKLSDEGLGKVWFLKEKGAYIID